MKDGRTSDQVDTAATYLLASLPRWQWDII